MKLITWACWERWSSHLASTSHTTRIWRSSKFVYLLSNGRDGHPRWYVECKLRVNLCAFYGHTSALLCPGQQYELCFKHGLKRLLMGSQDAKCWQWHTDVFAVHRRRLQLVPRYIGCLYTNRCNIVENCWRPFAFLWIVVSLTSELVLSSDFANCLLKHSVHFLNLRLIVVNLRSCLFNLKIQLLSSAPENYYFCGIGCISYLNFIKAEF